MTGNETRRAIAEKRDGGVLSDAAWTGIVEGFLAERVTPEQMAALCMAVHFRGMTPSETVALTRAMIASGETLSYGVAPVLDKHSSGGVGDTVSLLAVPIAAAAGVHVAKLAGRGLGHTGGTIDKLETLPGVRTALEPREFVANVERVGCAIAAQSARLVPADRRIYALRDATATVPSTGLIAASIVSKKIAAGADMIVYDVKYGAGAFMPDLASARALAERIASLTRAFGKAGRVYVTDMHEPLGRRIGDGLEALEALEILRGERSSGERLPRLALSLAQAMIETAGRRADATAILTSGAAYEKLLAMLAAQGGRTDAFAELAPHPRAARLLAPEDGYVAAVEPVFWGERARGLVERQGPFAGIELHVACGDFVRRGATLAVIHGDDDPAPYAPGVRLAPARPEIRPLVAATISTDDALLDTTESA